MPDDLGRVTCGTCGKTIKFPLSKSGLVAKCPNCAEPLRLVAAEISPPVQPAKPPANEGAPGVATDLDAMAAVLLAEQVPFVRPQLKLLPSQLMDGETVYVLAKGEYKKQQALVAATNYRVIFIRSGLIVGKEIDDLPISRISAIKSATGMLAGEIQIISPGHDVTISSVYPKQRADDVASFVSGRINGLPLPPRPSFVVPPTTSITVGALSAALLVVMIAFCGGCIGLSYFFGAPQNPPADGAPASVAVPEVSSPFAFVARKTEQDGLSNRMDLYALDGPLEPEALRELCRETMGSTDAKAFTFVVVFDSAENAAFPNSPFTAEYGLEEDKMRHIVAMFTFNKVNGFNELVRYVPNMWEGKAIREKI